MNFWCAECGTDSADTYVVTALEGAWESPEFITEVCLACHEAISTAV